jgi:hypothetical protein
MDGRSSPILGGGAKSRHKVPLPDRSRAARAGRDQGQVVMMRSSEASMGSSWKLGQVPPLP